MNFRLTMILEPLLLVAAIQEKMTHAVKNLAKNAVFVRNTHYSAKLIISMNLSEMLLEIVAGNP